MSEHSFDDKDVNGQLSEDANKETDKGHTVLTQKETDSDASTDSSSSSRKQRKSPHTVLKCPQVNISDSKCPCSLLPQNNDQDEHYVALLQEAQQSLTNRDTLITMLQEQLRKIENLYKQSLDDVQGIRLKYCLTAQELGNLKKICGKYREDVEFLSKERDKQSEEIMGTRKDANSWKLRYEELLKNIETMEEQVTETAAKISQEVQVELTQHQDLKTDLDTLKTHYLDIENYMKDQTVKLELLTQKVEKDLCASEKCKEMAESEETVNSQLVQALKYEVEHLKTEIQTLNGENKRYQKLQGNKAAQKEIEEDDEIINGIFVEVKDSLTDSLRKKNSNHRAEMDDLRQSDGSFASDNFRSCHCPKHFNEDNESFTVPQVVRGREGSKVSFVVKSSMGNASALLHREMFAQMQSSDEIEKLNTELTNVRRLLKQREDDIQELKYQAEQDIHKKDDLIQQLSNQNELLKSDYREVLQGSNTNEKTEIEKWRTKFDLLNANYKNLLEEKDKIKCDLENKNKELTEKEDANQTLLSTVAELRISLAKVEQDSEKYASELSCHAKCLKKLNELEIELLDSPHVNEKNETEEWRRKFDLLNANYENLLEEKNKIKCELENKNKELTEKEVANQTLLSTVAELRISLAKSEQDTEKYTSELSCCAKCQKKLSKVETELSDSPHAIEQPRTYTETLTIQIEQMNKTMQQYKEEAEFKKLENEKLRKKEEQLQNIVLCQRRNSEQTEKDYRQELDQHRSTISEIRLECDKLRNDSQEKLNTLSYKNNDLLNALKQKDEEIKQLKDNISEVTKELENAKSHHQKDCSAHERSIREITFLFKNKEWELSKIADELHEHEKILKELEEENARLKDLLAERRMLLETEEKCCCGNLSQQRNAERELSELSRYLTKSNENADELAGLAKMHTDLSILKVHLQKLLQILQSKLFQLKEEMGGNACVATSSKKTVDEMIYCIGKFNSAIMLQKYTTELQQDTHRDGEETEKYSYNYDEENFSDVRAEKNVQASLDDTNWKKNMTALQQVAANIHEMKGAAIKGENVSNVLQNSSTLSHLESDIQKLQEEHMKSTYLISKAIDELQQTLKIQNSEFCENIKCSLNDSTYKPNNDCFNIMSASLTPEDDRNEHTCVSEDSEGLDNITLEKNSNELKDSPPQSQALIQQPCDLPVTAPCCTSTERRNELHQKQDLQQPCTSSHCSTAERCTVISQPSHTYCYPGLPASTNFAETCNNKGDTTKK